MIAELLSESLAANATAAKLEPALASAVEGARSDDVRELAELVEGYLRGLPSALDALTAMAKTPHVGRGVAFAAGQVLLYLVDEDDLFSENEVGALGLLDDAYLAHAAVAACRSAFPQAGLPEAYDPPDARVAAAVRSLLPAGVAEALDRTCENLVAVAAALFTGNGSPAADASPPRPALRVDTALSSLAAAP